MKRIKLFLLTFLLCLPIFVGAKELKEDIATVPNSDLMNITDSADFRVDDSFNAEGNFFGSSFYAGNKVVSNSIVDGINFVAGMDVSIDGDQEYLFTAGNDIFVNGTILKDTFVAGNTVHLTGNLNRDVYALGSTVVISGNVARNVKIAGTDVTIKGTINGNVDIYADNIYVEDSAVITGKLNYNNTAVSSISDKASISAVEAYEVAANNKVDFKDVISQFVTSYFNLIIVSLVLIFLIPQLFNILEKKYIEKNASIYAKLFGKGLLFLIAIPFAIIALLFSSVGNALGFILLGLYILLIYIATTITGYIVGNVILTKLLKKKNNNYLNILVGVLVIRLLQIVPIIGGFVSVINLFVGLGILLELIMNNRKNK